MEQQQEYVHEEENRQEEKDDDDDEEDLFAGGMSSDEEEGDKEEEESVEDDEEVYNNDEEDATEAALKLLSANSSSIPPPVLSSSLELSEAEQDLPLAKLILNEQDQMLLLGRLMSRQFTSPGQDLALISDKTLRTTMRAINNYLAEEQAAEPETFPQAIFTHPSLVMLEAIIKARDSK